MGEAENKALVQRFYDEVWDGGNVEFARLMQPVGAPVFAGALGQ